MRMRDVLPTAVIFGLAGGYVWSDARTGLFQSPEERARIEQSVTYAGCDEVRVAGKAPLYAGEPGYREGMDGDGDGVACEPHLGT